MVKYYAEKIRTGAINQNTKLAWTLEDVKSFWREKVRKELEG